MSARVRSLALVAALASLLAAPLAQAGVVDAAGDILPTFTGEVSPALDILSAEVLFNVDAQTFTLHATAAGPIAGTAGASYIFGFNRGGATNSPFAALGAPGITFDRTAALNADGTGSLAGTALAVHIDDDEISATFAASLLPSTGLAFEDYTWALWSIDNRVGGGPRNADFAPLANVGVGVVPEPQSLALALLALAAVAPLRRRKPTRA
jgi:hypothetical protein